MLMIFLTLQVDRLDYRFCFARDSPGAVEVKPPTDD